MAQVKFYSVSNTTKLSDQGGIYFVDGGELYKGSERFGLGRVTKATTKAALDALKDARRGDINVGYLGAQVYDGTAWQPLGGDTESLQNSWKGDISAAVSGLVSGGTGSIITQITQDADGKVTATAVAFPAFTTGENDGEVKLGSQNAKVNGWDGLVASVAANTKALGTVTGRVGTLEKGLDSLNTGLSSLQDEVLKNATSIGGNTTSINTLNTKVTRIEGIVKVADGGTVSASVGSFATLTVGGSTVEQLADKQIAAIAASTVSASSNGITVGVTTSGGSVTAVTVDASTFGNVMRFRDTVSDTANVSNPAAGDIVVIAGVTDSKSTFVNGQEYIYTNENKWEVIGDQNTYATKATVDASFAAVASSWATLKGAAFVDTTTTVTADATTLPTCSAVATYVGSEIAKLDATVSASSNGVEFTVTETDGKLTAATLTGVGTAASANVTNTVTSAGTSLPTESAVASYVAAAIASALTWYTE